MFNLAAQKAERLDKRASFRHIVRPMTEGAKRRWDTGLEKPYRPCPSDFRDRFLEMGWDGIEDHYNANWRCIRRWIDECGGETLRAERRAVSGGIARPYLRSKPNEPGS